jgi:hypothetical protein
MTMAEGILDHFAIEQGWDESAKFTLCLEYIENQQDNKAWADFLRTHAALENEEEST